MDAETKREVETLKAALLTYWEGDGARPDRTASWYEALAGNAKSDDARDLFLQRAAVMRQKAESEQARPATG